MKLKIFFENSQNKERITYKLKMLVRSAIFNTLSFEGLFHDAEISVTFVDNEQIRDLNCHFRSQVSNDNRCTDFNIVNLFFHRFLETVFITLTGF